MVIAHLQAHDETSENKLLSDAFPLRALPAQKSMHG
jgi:hypothetical protein